MMIFPGTAVGGAYSYRWTTPPFDWPLACAPAASPPAATRPAAATATLPRVNITDPPSVCVNRLLARGYRFVMFRAKLLLAAPSAAPRPRDDRVGRRLRARN